MLPKRVLFLASCVALVAGADARALLAEPNAVRVAAVDEKDRVCVACKQFVTEGEQYINDPATLDKVALEVKKLCKDQGDESEQVRGVVMCVYARARDARTRGDMNEARARRPKSRQTVPKRMFQKKKNAPNLASNALTLTLTP